MHGIKRQFTPDLFKNKIIDRQGKLGEDACKIMASALSAVDPYRCVKKFITLDDHFLKIGRNIIPISEFDRIIVVGLGKAAVPMAKCVIDILGEKIEFASVVTKDQKFQKMNGYGNILQVHIGGHPIPTDRSISATKSILTSLPELSTRDIVIVLISGGGSALFTLPVKGVSLDDLQEMTEIMLNSGAEIKEINTIRKHLDNVKGGRLALRLQPAQMHTLILSDVIGDNLDMIASGPTVPDPTCFKDAMNIINKYLLKDVLPQAIIDYLEQGVKGTHPETLKADTFQEMKINNYLIGSNYEAAKAGLEKANSLAYNTLILSTSLIGETQYVAEFLGGIINSEMSHGTPLHLPTCLILGGETTVKVTGDGLGGRNQDLALRMVEKIAGKSGLLFVTLATDGDDGPTDAAGAAVDGFVFADGKDHKALDISLYIENNNSYAYLDQLGALIKTGSTGTNVNDLIFILFDKA